MQKLWHQVGGEWVEHTHPAVCAGDGAGGAERLVATAPGGDPNVLLSLVEAVGGPYALL